MRVLEIPKVMFDKTQISSVLTLIKAAVSSLIYCVFFAQVRARKRTKFIFIFATNHLKI